MNEKECITCGLVKSLSDFYAHKGMSDGHLNKCKDCQKACSKAAQDRRPDYYREKHRIKASTQKYIAARAAYSKTDAGKEARKKAQENYKERYPMKRAAHVMVGNAIRDGRIIKPLSCESCGDVATIEAHHDNYMEPLMVRWLCLPCHRKWHRENEAVYGSLTTTPPTVAAIKRGE